jgi:hypothetical protein
MPRAARPLSLFCVLLLCLLPSANALATDASVASRLDARGLNYVVDEDGDYKVTYNYSREGRTQLVFVSGGTEAVGGFRVREIFAPAAYVERDGIDGARALELLTGSSTNKLGSWEIRGDVLFFVIKLSDSMDAAQLEAAMDIAAETADDMEIVFSGDRDEL